MTVYLRMKNRLASDLARVLDSQLISESDLLLEHVTHRLLMRIQGLLPKDA